MKTSKLFSILMIVAALCTTEVFAQRGGGSRSGGSSSSGSSRSSSSHSSSSYSNGSRSTNSSFSSGSRSTNAPTATRSSYNGSASSASSRSGYNSGASAPRTSTARSGYTSGATRSSNSRSGYTSGSSSARTTGRSTATSTGRSSTSTSRTPVSTSRSAAPATAGYNNGARNGSSVGGRTSTSTTAIHPGQRTGNGRPGHPSAMPPSSRPMHPAPYFYHPHHHCMVHMHPIYWEPLPLRHWYWPGFWGYCNTYWYDYHVTDVVVVHEYVERTYGVDMVTFAISGELMYAIVKDGGQTFLQVYDQNDKLLVEQPIHRKYKYMEIDRENGGCWIFKKNHKDGMLFFFTDGQLLIYEAE